MNFHSGRRRGQNHEIQSIAEENEIQLDNQKDLGMEREEESKIILKF